MIEINGLSKTYKGTGRKALDSLCLTVNDGEIFGFLGPNGAGKSTAIKCITGILSFEEGSVKIGGVSMSDDPVGAKKRIGYVPDEHLLYEGLTGRQYIDFISDIYGVSRARRAELITEFVGLTFAVRRDYPDIYFAYDIPCWLDDEITLNGVTRPAYEFIIDNADRVTLMSYRDSCEGILSFAEDEIGYALSAGKVLDLGVETGEEEDIVTFYEEGATRPYREIEYESEIEGRERESQIEVREGSSTVECEFEYKPTSSGATSDDEFMCEYASDGPDGELEAEVFIAKIEGGHSYRFAGDGNPIEIVR